MFDDASWHPDCSDAFRQVVSHHRTGSDDGPSTDFAFFDDRRPGANVATFTQMDVTTECGVGVDVAEIANFAVVGDAGFDIQDDVSADFGGGGDDGVWREEGAFTD